MGSYQDKVSMAMAEIAEVLNQTEEVMATQFAEAILHADRVITYGLGREGLMLRAFTMRLMHLGIDAHVAGDVTAKPVGSRGLTIVCAGPGDLHMAETIVSLAKEAGSRTAVITAQPGGSVPALADMVVTIPAQTMANDAASESILPMGTAFEIALLIYLDLVAIRLREMTGQTMEDLRARHFNLE